MNNRAPTRFSRAAVWGGRLLLGIAIVVVLRRSLGGGRLFNGVAPWWTPGFLVALGLLFLGALTSALRWRAVLGVPGLSFPYLYRLYLMGQFASIFLPTSVGGDAFRAGALGARIGNVTRATTSVLFDRLIGVVGLLVVFLVGVLWGGLPSTIRVEGPKFPGSMRLLLVVGGLAGLSLLLCIPPVRRWVGRLFREVQSTSGRLLSRRQIPTLLVLAIVVQLCYIGVWAGLAHALGLQLSLGLLFVAVPVVSLVALLPISVSGLGLRETTWAWVLGQAGADPKSGLGLGLAYFAAYAIVGVFGAVWYLVARSDPSTNGSAQ